MEEVSQGGPRREGSSNRPCRPSHAHRRREMEELAARVRVSPDLPILVRDVVRLKKMDPAQVTTWVSPFAFNHEIGRAHV